MIAESTLDANGGIRRPHGYPQGDVQQRRFGHADLGVVRDAGGGPQRGDVHLGRLIPKRPLVLHYRSNDEVVTVGDDEQRSAEIGRK